jgi:hypothetical protein
MKKTDALKKLDWYYKKYKRLPTQAWVSRESGASVQYVNDLYRLLVECGEFVKLDRGLYDKAR